MEGVLFDAEYLPILAETIGKGDRIWEITKKGIAGEIDSRDYVRALRNYGEYLLRNVKKSQTRFQ